MGKDDWVDTHDKLADLTKLFEDARAMPMSASCIVNRGEVLALLDLVQRTLPADLARAEELLAERDKVIDLGHQEAERLLERAREEQHRLVSQSEVAREADEEAGQILAAAQVEAQAMRAEVDDYVDSKLANFEVVLTKTLQAVGRGRDRLRGLADAELVVGGGESLADMDGQSDRPVGHPDGWPDAGRSARFGGRTGV